MNSSGTIPPVTKTITVSCTPEEAFRYFTEDFGVWWPAYSQSVVAYASEFKDKPIAVVFEPCLGGRIFERSSSGRDHIWGKVLAWDPPNCVLFSFHPGRNEETAQTVAIMFASTPDGAQITLNHSGWEKLAADGQNSRDSYENGWESVFVGAYRQYVQRNAGRMEK